MKIGLAYDLKDDIQAGQDLPEDALEEYDSPEVVDAIAAGLRSLGHSTIKLGGGRQFLSKVLRTKVDFVFNIAEGRGSLRSREAQVPAVLEMLDIPYSGSDPQTLAITLDKPLAKQLVRAAGIPTPPWLLISSQEALRGLYNRDIPLPAFIKPACEGSSKGIRLASLASTTAKARSTARKLLKTYGQPVLVEQYIEGHEVTVGISGNSPPSIIAIMRVIPKKKLAPFVYSLEIKRDWRNLVEYECPAELDEKTMTRINEAALTVYQTLGCRDFSRVDFRVAADGTPYFLEVNPLPGLNPQSGDLPIMSYKMGWTYDKLVKTIFESALKRSNLCH
ncbi:MAG: ATP-grasp domain-containing protein [Dehalococcoidia bacterium]|nr:ATP-grasp domain-containing protein [Dehalococcoidia bacterium]